MTMKNIGIIGAGTMGRGVAELFARNDYNVTLVDCSEEVLQSAKKEIYNILRFRNLGKRDSHLISPEQGIDNIMFTTDLRLLCNMDFVIENVNEDFNLKKEIYLKIDEICEKNVIFAVNTSCISITKIASLTKRANLILGIHFMNPVAYINAVEVIKGFHTSEETLQISVDLLKNVNKEAIVVEDMTGFVSNRISHLMMNEAAFIVQDGVATPSAIDNIFRKCYGHKMGPLETADLIGIDTVVASLDVLYDSYKDAKYRCCPILRKMSDAGLIGRKSGEGFYKY